MDEYGELIIFPAIRIGRAKSWNGISNRNHRVQAVYSHDLEASDMLLVGVIDAALTNGKTLSAEFAARVAINFEGAAKEKPRIALYKSWAVCWILIAFFSLSRASES
jgi:hypothetical protein